MDGVCEEQHNACAAHDEEHDICYDALCFMALSSFLGDGSSVFNIESGYAPKVM